MPDPELTVEPAPYQPAHVFLNDPEDPEAWKRTAGEHVPVAARTKMR